MKIIKTILFETVFKDEKNYNHCCWAVPNPKKNEALLFCSSASSMVVKK